MTLKRNLLKHYFLEVVTYLFVLLFVYAAVSKLLDFENFQVQLGQSPILSAYAKPVSIGIPLLELLIALGLTIPRFRLSAFYGFYGIMVMFTTYIVIIIKYSPFVPCSCGGVLDKMGWTEHLVFNIGFVLLAITGILMISLRKPINKEYNF